MIVLTEPAANKIKELLAEETQENLHLRISVQGGGCSGMKYVFVFDDQQAEDDTIVEMNGVEVLVDSMSLLYLDGSEIDFVESLQGSSFNIKNPNTTAKCGCGSSFAV